MAQAQVQGFLFEYENAEEFRLLKHEIFTEHQYYVDLKTSKPRIIDAGAHIGMATGYFKWLYPESEIVAIEPNPRLIPLLSRNVEANQWWGVEIDEVALTGGGELLSARTVPFFFDKSEDRWYSTGGFNRGAWNHKQQSWELQVKAKPLAYYLNVPVDLLKLDVEGAEQAVLQATGERIKQVKQIVMEYHPVKGNSLNEIEQYLTRQGFTFEVREERRTDEGLKLIKARQME